MKEKVIEHCQNYLNYFNKFGSDAEYKHYFDKLSDYLGVPVSKIGVFFKDNIDVINSSVFFDFDNVDIYQGKFYNFGVDLFDNETLKLPFSICLFKKGDVACVFIDDERIELNKSYFIYVRNKGDWVITPRSDYPKFEKVNDTVQSVASALLFGGCGVLYSKDYETEIVPAPEKLNKHRIRQGKLPISERRVVRLTPEAKQLRREYEAGYLKGTHASPVPHVRRGHVRKLSEDRITWVAPHWVNSSKEMLLPKPKNYVVSA